MFIMLATAAVAIHMRNCIHGGGRVDSIRKKGKKVKGGRTMRSAEEDDDEYVSVLGVYFTVSGFRTKTLLSPGGK